MKELIIAFGLFLFLEGFLYAIFPEKMKSIILKLNGLKENQLRFGGFIFLFMGFVIIWVSKN